MTLGSHHYSPEKAPSPFLSLRREHFIGYTKDVQPTVSQFSNGVWTWLHFNCCMFPLIAMLHTTEDAILLSLVTCERVSLYWSLGSIHHSVLFPITSAVYLEYAQCRGWKVFLRCNFFPSRSLSFFNCKTETIPIFWDCRSFKISILVGTKKGYNKW